jgi:hypothetical protein
MRIRPIDQNYAQLLVPHRDPVLQFFAVEKAWFASDDDRLLGTVLYHRCSNEWAFVVLGIDERGCYRWIGGDVSLKTQQEAVDRTHAEMERIAETGKTIFERPLTRFFQDIREVARMRRARRAARRAQRRAYRELFAQY